MKRYGSRSLGLRLGALAAVVALLGLALGLAYYLRSRQGPPTSSKFKGSLPNNQPIQNPGGEEATVSTRGAVNLTGEFFKAQGKNGQSCATCHIPEEAWSITPATLQRLFDETDGKHPVFSPLDANNPKMDVSTKEARRAAYSMLLTRGDFRRGGAPPPNAEWEVIAVEDPHGLASANQLVFWRRSMPTINFALGSSIVNWDSANSRGTDQHAGLVHQTGRLVTGALQGPPATDEVINDMVDFETSLVTAQLTMTDVGRLDADGARGGPEALSTMKKAQGGFDIFDAWKNDPNPKRAQIERGQEVFNSVNVSHKSCIVCHNSLNNGTNFINDLFDIRTASEEARTPDLPLYTFRNKQTGEIIKLTDAGLGNITGLWDDLGRFKTPTLRGLAARAPYFHNGIAMTLEDVVRHYETRFGFRFTDQERADLVAFLKAL
jgi:cytochrome c peroxidase